MPSTYVCSNASNLNNKKHVQYFIFVDDTISSPLPVAFVPRFQQWRFPTDAKLNPIKTSWIWQRRKSNHVGHRDTSSCTNVLQPCPLDYKSFHLQNSWLPTRFVLRQIISLRTFSFIFVCVNESVILIATACLCPSGTQIIKLNSCLFEIKSVQVEI